MLSVDFYFDGDYIYLRVYYKNKNIMYYYFIYYKNVVLFTIAKFKLVT